MKMFVQSLAGRKEFQVGREGFQAGRAPGGSGKPTARRSHQ